MALRHLVLGDGHEAGDARFRGEQVVIVGIQTAAGQIIANVENLPLGVKQEAKIHLCDKTGALLG